MKLLLISRLFAPKRAIGAVRPTQLAKYLALLGNEVTCITEGYADTDYPMDAAFPARVIRVTAGRVGTFSIGHTRRAETGRRIPSVGSAPAAPKKRNRFVAAARRQAAQLMHTLDEAEWAKRAVRAAEKVIEADRPDILFTSFGPESAVLAGLSLKKKYPDIPWVSDMRDPMLTVQLLCWRYWLNARWEKKAMQKADGVTTVSTALGVRFEKQYRLQGVGVFVNGYAPEETAADTAPADGVLRIGYTGALYGGLSKLDALLTVIKSLEEKGGGHLPLEIHYAGGDADEFFRQAEQYHAADYLVNHGLVDKAEAQRLQTLCDILLVLSWNTETEQGVLTGKFPEYLRLKKTVLALITGDTPGAELTDRIHRLNIGFSYEETMGEAGQRQLESWLSERLAEKKTTGRCAPQADAVAVEEYAYPQIVRRLNEFLLKIKER